MKSDCGATWRGDSCGVCGWGELGRNMINWLEDLIRQMVDLALSLG